MQVQLTSDELEVLARAMAVLERSNRSSFPDYNQSTVETLKYKMASLALTPPRRKVELEITLERDPYYIDKGLAASEPEFDLKKLKRYGH